MASIFPSDNGQLLISKDGTKIWAEAAGDPANPPVVFIHGVACTALVFDNQFSDSNLLDNIYMIRYEMRGHGRSGHPLDFDSYASLRFAEDFMAVYNAFQLKKPFICGWSMGSFVPVDVIEAYGAGILGGIILPGGPAITRSLHTEYMGDFLKNNVPRFLSSSADIQGEAAVEFIESCVRNPEAMSFETKMKWIGGYVIQSATVRTHLITREQSSQRWEKEIQNVPVLLIQGDSDRHVVVDKIIPMAQKYYARLELHVLKGCGHTPCFERAEETNRLLLDFVQRHAVKVGA
ncbi:hypothetical protein QCA50_019301 [Cerrena zonata]|uniref:Serine aminopeptidase S33 domain-containing protein n=1 Tax=Cerrena zonata TaxID=2478898 RepID=A0AAW0FFR4_9APHY